MELRASKLDPESLPGRIAALGIAAFAAVATGCGGGGGASTTPSSPNASGSLIPAAPAVGATLYPTAATLRPLRAGARWVYRTDDRTQGQFVETVVSQTAAANGGVTETDSSDPQATSELSVEAGSGTVNFSVSLELVPNWTPVIITGPELRSPVRQGDQYDLIEQRFSNQPIDIDADGKFDTVDVASYRRVVGNELVTLPNRAQALTALRVDTVLTIRINPSTRTTPQIASSSVSTWYAPGIGVIRQVVASTDPSRSFDEESLLLGWDGLTEGWGFVTQPAQLQSTVVPGSSSVWVGGAMSAIALSDGALIATASSLHRVDRRGMVQSSETPPVGQYQGLMRLSAGNRWLTGSWPNYQMYALSDSGATLGAGALSSFTLGSTDPSTLAEYPLAMDGNPGADHFWIASQRTVSVPSTGNTAYQLVLRAIGADGSTTRPEIVIAVGSPQISPGVRLAAHAGGVLATWTETTSTSNNRVHYASITAAGQVEYHRSIAVLSLDVVEGLKPLADDGLRWLVWRGPTGSGTVLVAHAVALDSAGNLAGVTADEDGLRSAVVGPFSPEASASWPTGFTAANGDLFAAVSGFGLALPDERFSIQLVEYSVLNLPTLLPSSALPAVTRFRIPGTSIPVGVPPALVFSDRVLLLSSDTSGRFAPTVIWR
ncbi:hypothetical protein [Brooklawnia sp.]|uniref:hypothetical protein n=1 Tax=Brooklawnia sp. TaxID=2699740 RepID=UPI00311ED54B